MKVFLVLAIVLVSVAAVQDIQKCRNVSKKMKNDDITIENCDKPPCLLKRRTVVEVAFKFVPETDIKTCKTSVFGIIGGLPLPFVGVDDTDCCPDIYNAADEKVGCPMKAGQEYVYKNQIKILALYPKVNVVVEWQLLNGANKNNIMCFQVDAKITS